MDGGYHLRKVRLCHGDWRPVGGVERVQFHGYRVARDRRSRACGIGGRRRLSGLHWNQLRVNYQVLVSSSSGTPVQCGPILAFKIGTSFTSVAITTIAAPLPPLSSSAFGGTAALPGGSAYEVFPPFAAIATVTAGTAAEAARIDFPAGFLNYIGRTIRVKLWAVFTPGSGATLIPSFNLYSLYTTTSITPWTITTVATSGTTQSDLTIELTLMTTAVGASGTLEAHGVMLYAGVTGSAPAYLAAGDAIHCGKFGYRPDEAGYANVPDEQRRCEFDCRARFGR